MSRRLLIALLATLTLGAPAFAQGKAGAPSPDKSIVVASTTSTQDSGLFGHILPIFKAKTGIDVKVIAQGTATGLDTGRRGDADVVFVHARPAEQQFLAEGAGVARPGHVQDFVLIGPKKRPRRYRWLQGVAALKAIKAKGAPFVSRGDKNLSA